MRGLLVYLVEFRSALSFLKKTEVLCVLCKRGWGWGRRRMIWYRDGEKCILRLKRSLVGLQVSATSPKIAHKTPDDATRTQRAPTLDKHIGNHYSIYVETNHQVISYLTYI